MEEILKIAHNGQWTLEKNWTPKHKQLADKWAEGGIRKDLNKLPTASGKLRSKMLSDLHQNAQEHRVNPETGHKEYKMFRAMPEGGHENDFHSKNKTSWTLDPGFAHYWAHNGQTPLPDMSEEERADFKPHQVVSSWIPEHKIHSYLPSVLPPNHEKIEEKEVIVEPHDIKPHKIYAGKALKENIKKLGIA